MAHQSPIRKPVSSQSSAIPDKLYFRIGEVARLCEVPAYVLRFWESEFPQLRPNKGGSGQRLFRRRDVEMALRIKGLLYDEGYTIPGARQLLKGEQRQAEIQLPLVAPESLRAMPPEQVQRLRSSLLELLEILSTPAQPARSDPVRRRRAPGAGASRTEELFDLETGCDETGKEDTEEPHG